MHGTENFSYTEILLCLQLALHRLCVAKIYVDHRGLCALFSLAS